jgi:hypothetical protein
MGVADFMLSILSFSLFPLLATKVPGILSNYENWVPEREINIFSGE